MTRARRALEALALVLLAACQDARPSTPEPAPHDDAGATSPSDARVNDASAGDAIPRGTDALADAGAPEEPASLACLAHTYAGAPARAEDGRWGLRLDGGVFVPWTKRDDERTDTDPFDLADIWEQAYPTGPIKPITEVDFDPGRVRVDPLFLATYGRTAAEVMKHLVTVVVGGKGFPVHEKVAPALRRVAARVSAAMAKDPSLARFFAAPGGTFNWRFIAGTKELSMHSWGIAIDLDTGLSHYWRNEPAPPKWKNKYPQAIVDAFEAEGFIWGGRWYHFDTMHFEYRPELAAASCAPHRKT